MSIEQHMVGMERTDGVRVRPRTMAGGKAPQDLYGGKILHRIDVTDFI